MKRSKIDDLQDGDVLAQDILVNNYQILLASGTVLKKEYIEKLKELGINEVSIRENTELNEEQISILREEIEQTFFRKVKEVLENHMYQHSTELSELSRTADVIITEILEDDRVIEKVYDIKERSADMYEHSISLCTLATIMALKYQCDKSTTHDIGVACLLHDLGLRYLTISYQNQNFADLSEFDYTEYKKHPVYAYTSLRNESWISDRCKNMILMHHEHLDGSGYPLHATNIPREVQMIAVCDIFDEMICGIGCVRQKVYEAIEFLKNSAGRYFDKGIVETFIHFVAVYPVGTKVLTNEGETGVVIRQNRAFPDRPVIRIMKDKNGQNVKETILKDLTKELTVFVDSVIDQ